MLVRFQTDFRHSQTQWGTGLLRFLGEIMHESEVDPHTLRRIDKLFIWFNENLPKPPRKKVHPRAIFWFKCTPELGKPQQVKPWKRRPLTKLAARTPKLIIPSTRPIDQPIATECMAKMSELVTLVRNVNIGIRIIQTTRPGYILYEDPYQIAAIPFKDTLPKNELDDWLQK